MSLPLANQVRNVYVATSLVSSGTPDALGEISVGGETGKYLFFQHYGHGGLTASDKIDVDKIRYIKNTAGSALDDILGAQTVKVTNPVAGQVYEIKLRFLNYIGQGAQDFTYRIGTYRAKSSDGVNDIAAGLAASLQATLGLEKGATASDPTKYKEPIATVEVSGDTITVKEVEQYWELGKFTVARMPIEISLNGIVTDDNYFDYEWATITDVTKTSGTDTNNATKKLADLEYFCMGNRADQYRGMGWPRTAESKLMVDLSETYNVIDIHYFFQGTGVSVQQSEKELTIICKSSEASDLVGAIETMMGASSHVTTKKANNEGYPEQAS